MKIYSKILYTFLATTLLLSCGGRKTTSDADIVLERIVQYEDKIAKKYDKKVIAFAGAVTKDAIACNEHGIDAFFPILRRIQTLQEAMDAENARDNMISTVEQVFRLIACAK